MAHHHLHAQHPSSPAAVHGAYPGWDAVEAPTLSDRHSPGTPGDRLRSPEEILDHLVGLVGPEVAGPASIWISFLTEDDRIMPVAMPIEDLPTLPDGPTMYALSARVVEVIAETFPGAVVLVAVVRADGGDYGAHERRWARALWQTADAGGWDVRAMAAIGTGRARIIVRDQCM